MLDCPLIHLLNARWLTPSRALCSGLRAAFPHPKPLPAGAEASELGANRRVPAVRVCSLTISCLEATINDCKAHSLLFAS